jgi:hypothetical protein
VHRARRRSRQRLVCSPPARCSTPDSTSAWSPKAKATAPQVLIKHYGKSRQSADRRAAEHLGKVIHGVNGPILDGYLEPPVGVGVHDDLDCREPFADQPSDDSTVREFSDERKTWSRLPYRRRGIHFRPTACRRRAGTRTGFPRTSPKRLCRELWSEDHLPQHRKAM